MCTLNEIESKYCEAISDALEGKDLTASLLVELSSNFYNELKVKDISHEIDDDILLYQYGVYDWNDEHGRHFVLDIARQFQLPSEDEPYQLSFSLIFDPEQFENIGAYDCWSMDFGDIESFVAHIKTTDGFKVAEDCIPRTYCISFYQC